ncbi:MAG: hypothetical protein RL662_875 [Bacteroidota bacterium]|jgi:hypothetical protein
MAIYRKSFSATRKGKEGCDKRAILLAQEWHVSKHKLQKTPN